MNFPSRDIIRIAQNVWQVMFALPVQAQDRPVSVRGDDFVTSSIDFFGDWNGGVIFDCSLDLARSLTAIMLRQSVENVGEDITLEALRELTNILAGNIKVLLPGCPRLSLPTRTRRGLGWPQAPGNLLLQQIQFQCGEEIFFITLKQRDSREHGTSMSGQSSTM